MGDELDPMLSDDPAKREAYRQEMLDKMKQAVDEDRESHRKTQPPAEATLIGAMGMSGGINRAG